VLNDAVGFVIHSVLLVPYWSWKLSHAKHHKYTNHTTLGETHVPSLRHEVLGFRKFADVVGEDAFSLVNAVEHLVFGWPMYLIANATGGRVTHEKRPMEGSWWFMRSHFIGHGSQLYDPKYHAQIWASTAGIVAVFFGLFRLAQVYGASAVLLWYGGPYMVVNMWLVLYTWLQHSHEDVPHLGDDAFTWIRGALSTVDRPYPSVVDELHHHIGSTHVLHHLFSRVPHYHAQAATRAIRKELRGAYRYDDSPIGVATFQVATKCIYIDGTDGVQYFKDASGCASACASDVR
jgi:omega-6 fatty acid desaturase (delta-12 desaturase)